jgi:hypothetical protein
MYVIYTNIDIDIDNISYGRVGWINIHQET